jgi:ketosteroid isomerase-like protein
LGNLRGVHVSAEESNKEMVAEFFQKYGKNDLAGRLAMLHEDLVWWVAGGDLFPFSGTRNKAEYTKVSSAIWSHLRSVDMEPTGMVAEGDRVAVEVKGHAVTIRGSTYDNLYHFLFSIKDGKIIVVKEYLDTLYAKTVLIDS